MASTTVTPVTGSDHATARRLLVPTAVGIAVVTLVLEWFRADSQGESLSMMAFSVAASVLVFGLLLPNRLRHEASPKAALALSVVAAVLTPVAFWSGLPLVLGGAGALLGFAGKRSSSRSGLCIAALVVGVIAGLGYLGIYLGDWISNPGVSWHH